MIFAFAQGASPLGGATYCIRDEILMHILHVILIHILDVLIPMHILDVLLLLLLLLLLWLLLLLLATTLIAPLLWDSQPQSNNAAGSVVVPETTVLSLTMVLRHKYTYIQCYLLYDIYNEMLN